MGAVGRTRACCSQGASSGQRKIKQINHVAGRAGRELRVMKNKRRPINRRITLLVERGSGLEESAIERLLNFLEKPTKIRAKITV